MINIINNLLLVPIFLALVLMHSTATQSYANGRVVSFEEYSAGPYTLFVGSIPPTPVIGKLHLTMTIKDINSASQITHASVLVSAVGPFNEKSETTTSIKKPEIGPVAAISSPAEPQYYDVAFDVDRIGKWDFKVSIEASAGEGLAEFSMEVQKPSPLSGILTLVTVITFLGIIAFAVRAIIDEKRKNRSRKL